MPWLVPIAAKENCRNDNGPMVKCEVDVQVFEPVKCGYWCGSWSDSVGVDCSTISKLGLQYQKIKVPAARTIQMLSSIHDD